MVEAGKAVDLLQQFAAIEVRAVHQCNTIRGISKKTQKEEAHLVALIFEAMTGRKPTQQEIEAVVRW